MAWRDAVPHFFEGKMESLLFTREDLKKLIVPLIIEQALALSIGLFDTLMVSSCGEAAVSGVSLVDSISTLLIQILSALGVQPVYRQEDAGEGKAICRTADAYHAVVRGDGDGGHPAVLPVSAPGNFWTD